MRVNRFRGPLALMQATPGLELLSKMYLIQLLVLLTSTVNVRTTTH